MSCTDPLGDRMKAYENDDRLLPLAPYMARMDGRGFHRFCKGMTKPFDLSFRNVMIDTTKKLVEVTGAVMGYTQSDEITLAFFQRDYKSQMYWGGQVQKLVSSLAANTSLIFSKLMGKTAAFDARVWSMPNKTEVANNFSWREMDATRNSITMAAQSVYSHKELHGVSSSDMQEMLFAKGINWNDYPASFKRGTYVKRMMEIHQMLTGGFYSRTKVDVVDMPRFMSIMNREAVVFDGDAPIVREES